MNDLLQVAVNAHGGAGAVESIEDSEGERFDHRWNLAG